MRRVARIGIAASAAAVVFFAARSLRDGSVRAGETGPLAPLAPLVGEWVDPAGATRSFAWGPEGQTLREARRDADGGLVETTTYFWHPDKVDGAGSLALLGVAADGSVREGILREDAERSLELRFNAFDAEAGGASYRERLRWLDDDRLLRTLHRKTETAELLVEEHELRTR